MTGYRPSDTDIYLFHEGTNYRSYLMMGAHLHEVAGIQGVRFVLWAPNAAHVAVVGDFNNWQGEQHPMEPIDDSGLWATFIPHLQEGDLYKYEIRTKDGQVVLKSDPYGFYAQLRPHTASIVYNLFDYQWQDHQWQQQKNSETGKSHLQQPMLIYEVHLGSWKRNEQGEFLTYRELAEQLVDYVVDMGYTHIELLPLVEYPFDGSWGYQGTGYYAATSRYGEPKDLMYFIDRCHQEGIGVLLDWVPGHFCKDNHGLSRFDGCNLYEHWDSCVSENIQWDTVNLDYGRPEVQCFLISNAMFWLDMYHVDGIRVDAVANMLYLDYGKQHGQWRTNQYGGRENLEAIAFLQKLNRVVFQYHPQVLMIAEESTTWPMVTKPDYMGGLGFNYKWNMGWMNDMLEYMQMDPYFRQWHHNLVTFSFMYAFSENFILPLSHDEVVHGKKSLINKMPGDYWQKFAHLRGFMGYMMAHPGKKLMFMGGEFGQFIEWQYDNSLDWHLLEYPMHAQLHHYIKQLNKFYRKESSLWQQDFDWTGFQWIDPHHYSQSIITFQRMSHDDFVVVLCNFTPVVRHGYRIGVPQLGCYEEIFNSDQQQYGGSGQENSGQLTAEKLPWHNQPYSLTVTVPPLATIFLKHFPQ